MTRYFCVVHLTTNRKKVEMRDDCIFVSLRNRKVSRHPLSSITSNDVSSSGVMSCKIFQTRYRNLEPCFVTNSESRNALCSMQTGLTSVTQKSASSFRMCSKRHFDKLDVPHPISNTLGAVAGRWDANVSRSEDSGWAIHSTDSSVLFWSCNRFQKSNVLDPCILLLIVFSDIILWLLRAAFLNSIKYNETDG